MDPLIRVTRLAADVAQTLLATTVDIEQRWQFLTPADRVNALADLIAVTLVYNRAITDNASLDDLTQFTTGKSLADIAAIADMPSLDVGLLEAESVALSDVATWAVDYARSLEDGAGISDALEMALTFVRSFVDTFAVQDAISQEATKAFDDIGGLYAEAGYFADDYWQAGGPTLFDAAIADVGKLLAESLTFADLLEAVAEYSRAFADAASTNDDSTLQPHLVRAEAVPLAEQTTLDIAAIYADTATPSDIAALSFVTQMQELASVAEDFARTVNYARTHTDTAALSDLPAKTFTTAFSELGLLYAQLGYFADDYVAAPTGPSVYDSFSYTLA